MKSKRLLLLLLLALVAPWAANAQTRETLTFNFEDQTIPSTWTNDATYPWVVTDAAANAGTYSIKSGNSGVNSSTSTITATYTFAGDGSISFAVRCSSEQTNPSYDWDYGTFYIDGVQQGSKIINSTTFSTLSYDVEAGEHTFMWKYKKDSSVGSNDDCLYVDDIVIDLGVAASTPKPTGLAVSNILHNEATLSWTENGTATSWQLCINGDEDNPTTINTNPYTLTNLTATTAYTVKVRSVGNGEYSAWSNEVSFSTTAVAVAVGDAWSDDFEGETCGWELINGDLADAWVWGTATNNGGTHAIYISDDGGTTWNYSHNSVKVLAAKLLTFTEGKFTFSYDWNCYGESNYDFLRVALVPASQTLTAGSDYGTISTTSLPTGWIALDGGKLNQVQTWQNKEVTINVSAGNYYLVFAWRSDSSTQNQPPAAVDNVSITKVTCDQDVTNLAVNNITTTGATLSWEGGEATQWQVAYSTTNSFEGATEEIVDAATYTMSGLNPSTVYYAKVRAYCGGEDYGEWSNVLSFPTACEVIPALGYTENFDSYTAGANVLPICWNYINTTTNTTYAVYPRVYANSSWSTYANSAPNCLYFYSYYSSSYEYDPQDQYAILPAMEGLNGKQITLFAKGGNANSAFKVGMMTDPADANTFVEIATQALTTSYQEFNYILGEGNYVAIMIEAANADRTSNSVYVDDIVIAEAPTCLKPTDLEVTANALTATLTWVSEVGAYEIAHAMEATANPDESIVGTATEATYTMNDLALGDHYFWVRANCGGSNGNSQWVGPVSVHIGYCVPTPSNVDGNGISNVTFGMGDNIVNNDTPKATYADYSSQIGAVQAGVESTIAITYATGYTYGTIIWVDFDNSLSFEESEIVYTGTSGSANPTTLNAAIIIPATQTPGDYMMRIGGADSGFDSYISGSTTTAPSACYTGSWACFQDYTLRVLEAPSCLTPTNLATSNITGHTAELSWTAGGEETAWQICINRDETNLIDVTTNPYTLPELAPETEYIVMVRANCGEEDGVSAWSNEVVFTTDVACPAPTALTVSNVTPVGATISWEGSAESYTLRYKAASGFNYGFEQAEPWAVDNFPPCTTYDGDQTQTYAFDGATFTNIPYTGACIAFQSQTGNMSSHNGNAFGLMISAVPGEEAAVQNNDWFILPELTIAEGDIFSFWGREITDQYGDEIINVGVYGSTEGTFASLLAEELAISGTEWTLYSYDLSAYAGQTIRLAINYISTDVFGFMFDDIFVGNPNAAEWDEIITDATSPYVISGLTAETVYDVEVQANCGEEGNSEWVASSFTTLSLCNAISELTVTNVSGTGATLNWTGFMDSYNVRYRTAEDADILFFEDFSNGIGDWTTENLNASSGIYENSWFRFYWTTTPPQYLISPELEGVVSGTTLQFVYAAPSTNYTETFQVGVSSTDNSIDSFTWGEEISTVNNQGQYYVTELPEGTKYFAIKCTSDDQLYLYVTNFLVFANHVEAGEWVELNGVTSPLAIPGLTPDTWYEWQVQGVDCGEYWFDGEAFQTLATVTQTMELTAGWNWWSTYIDADNLLSQLEASLGTNGMAISTTGGGLTYRNGRWMGTINSISNSKGYKVRTNAPVTVEIEGLVINPEECPITINPGWNWIGYPVTEAQAVGTALAGFTPTNGDNIKTQGGGATYRNGRWMPANFTLEPGKSYAYKSNSTETTTLIFSNSAKSVSESKANGGKYVFKTMPVSPKNQIEGTKEVSLTKKFINSNN